ncbi:hypothetical protein BD779DRAFT_251463 [Infundibulicybe gibba]|nr:hypothetical protein BD779DRAFT_251463 [Infundibulicybe gibba]
MVIIAAILFILACGSLFAQGNVIAQPTFGCHIGLSHDASMRRHMKFRTRGLTLITLLLRDGAIYFAVMALSNLANILTFYLCGPFLRGGLSTFSTSISVTIMSRLILNLHETANIGLFSTHNTTSACVSRLEFLNESLGGSELSRIQETVGRSGTLAEAGECKNVLPDF